MDPVQRDAPQGGHMRKPPCGAWGRGGAGKSVSGPEPRGSKQGLSRQMLDDDDNNKITTPRVDWIPALCQTLCIPNLV